MANQIKSGYNLTPLCQALAFVGLIALCALSDSSRAGGEGSGGGLVSKSLNGMSVRDILLSDQFEVRNQSIRIPTLEKPVNPLRSLCITGRSVKTISSVGYCEDDLWVVDFKNTLGYKLFHNYREAYDSSRGIDARSAPYCKLRRSGIVTTPIQKTNSVCVLWSVDTTQQQTLTFATEGDAQIFRTFNNTAVGEVRCAKQKSVTNTIPTRYQIEIYRKDPKVVYIYDDSLKLGEAVTTVPNCSDLAP